MQSTRNSSDSIPNRNFRCSNNLNSDSPGGISPTFESISINLAIVYGIQCTECTNGSIYTTQARAGFRGKRSFCVVVNSKQVSCGDCGELLTTCQWNPLSGCHSDRMIQCVRSFSVERLEFVSKILQTKGMRPKNVKQHLDVSHKLSER